MDIKLHAPRGTMVSLGWSNRGGGGGGGGGDEGIPPESLFQLYGGSGAGDAGDRNQVTAATYTRGFELWQQQQQQIQRQQQQQYSFYPPSAGLLNFGDPVGAAGSSRRSGGGGIGTVEFGMRGRGGGGGVSCQDCGNQSKKDCAHMRCRTCCKSRGFPCPTHVKSTWIPASKRRERQQLAAAASALQQQSQLAGGGGGGGGEPCKRPREISTRLSTAIATTSSGNGGDAPSFPAEVSSPVVFRCVRVSPIDDAEDELAYQTEVRVQGHVFKGILYDYGPDVHRAGESSSLSAAAAVLTTTTTTTTAAIGTSIGAAAVPAVDAAAARAGLLDTSPLYPPPFGAFMAGSQFFPHHPRP